MSKEKLFKEGEILLSITDLESNIKYANKNFCNIAGYSAEELQGNPHNMVRHPDMPKVAFKDLWQYAQSGRVWMGPVKNRCKNGDYYWVNAFVTPIKNSENKVVEYQSVRTVPEREVVDRAEKVYKKINAGQTPLQLKFNIDMTLLFQVFFICSLLFSIFVASLSELTPLITLPMVFMSAVFTALCFNWRLKFKKLIKEAKTVFDNPLMSYIYSGNNNAISAITLALKMREAELKAIVGRVSDVSEDLTVAAKKSSECGVGISDILSQQNNETDQVATAMNQMSATVQDLAEVVDKASQASKHGLDVCNQGHQLIQESIEANNDLSEQLGEVDQAILRLVNGTKSIETVLKEISSIADQTNLLALNAAIEAARAGDQGRGFAIVADEVRALAMRTQQSTTQINELLGQLQSESSCANIAMTKGSELSVNCVQLSEKTGESLTQIIFEVSELTNLNIQIATAIEEQTLVSEEINRNIVAISDMAATAESLGEQSVGLSNELLGKIEEQQALVSQFS